MKLLYTTLLMTLMSISLLGQDTLTGIIVDSELKNRVAYVNVGVVNKGIGTVSSVNGEFKLIIPAGHDNDSLKISSIGYQPFVMKVSAFKKSLLSSSLIELTASTIKMKEFVVSGRELKTRILGNKTTSEMVTLGFTSNELGNEMGVRIKLKRKPTYVKNFNVNIVNSIYDTLRFRINFYDVKNGKPNKRILNKNIIVETTLKKGKLTVDLSDYNIVVEEDFFVTMEWIEDLGPTSGLTFSGGFLGSSIVVRDASQGEWGKFTGVSVGINVKVKY